MTYRLWQNKRSLSGFTIVELLIVIVVIGIVAALIIVSFNGVQNRARKAELTSSLRNASVKIKIFEDGTAYPETANVIGITNSDTVKYAYTVNNTASPATFCLAASAGALSMFIDQSSLPAAEGICAGSSDVGDGVSTDIIGSNEYSSQLGVRKAFDGGISSTSKWLATTPTPNVIFSTTAAVVVNSYSITSANDNSSRDPTSWRLEGSVDRTSWTLIDIRNNEDFPSRSQTKTFSFSNSKSFKHYKYTVIQNSGATWMQIAELSLAGATVVR